MADEKLFNYYERQDVLPTFGNFKSAAELDAYASQRRELFSDKLVLPPRLFRDAEVLEFGPDSGENALVFAGWGANMTLAEPNRHAHQKIEAYFAHFGLTERLRELALADVEGFRSERRYDIIDAEGFIYTVQPTENWLGVFHRLLNPDGFAIVSYYERYGGFFELALKAIHAAGKALSGRPALETAKSLFEAKWNSIPHTRSFESWLMDVLENPFVRHRYFLDATALCTAAHAQGFDIHSAWPAYRDSLDVYWHKKVLSPDEKLRRAARHLDRSRLSFLGGRKLYLVGKADAAAAISASIETLVLDVDAMIDDPFGESLPRAVANLASLREAIRTTDILADDASDIETIVATLDSFHRIFGAIGRRDASAVAALTQTDPAFINTWGQPAHFLVMRKRFGGS
ncbi:MULTISPECIES: class I SAM-dependent methyltransferase [Bradyrhizobium]|uniref:class I SAM-dependent methyltransferase n=1 Tax=Bradyrhizobium TaxID=374 RepID=UPI00155F21EC|nr:MULTISPECIES: class I SAM-dependent methyltransferase [Bradyrhizobium]MDD1516439.1 class I SAM-dependent methyltransferase [Bradyrhizobium sp. WBAH30]MDD1542645.1 class I SAM-dependent methyltransferase [Bradyrhizobium sp. WBAH41]MDD1554342.1 class I SAM-dependent methyltransferase [Bradyrhizobium sp. WBAH23]MDD1562293.1 class I SAM-dependent methyltransferase [Bradyrhizobium sp. WBAH33]MDD1588587.1 class I SAM-dependent methyltransferase [Bradyrhizobium sp. WBAH42]